jgi:hypothetical protein
VPGRSEPTAVEARSPQSVDDRGATAREFPQHTAAVVRDHQQECPRLSPKWNGEAQPFAPAAGRPHQTQVEGESIDPLVRPRATSPWLTTS